MCRNKRVFTIFTLAWLAFPFDSSVFSEYLEVSCVFGAFWKIKVYISFCIIKVRFFAFVLSQVSISLRP